MDLENHFGKVYRKILAEIDEKRGLVFQQVDPVDLGPELAGKIGKIGEEIGLSAFAVGGSMSAQGELLHETIKALKENSGLPTILFPGNIATLSPHADAIYYMSMLNSDDPYYISGAQMTGAFPTKQMKLEVIPTSYVIVEPGRAAGWVGRARPVPKTLPYLAAATALGGKYLGSHLIILEAGGGADSPATPEMISLTRKAIEDTPLLVAGGVRTPEYAYDSIKAGADIVQVGTAIEKSNGDLVKAKETIKKIVDAARKAGQEKK